jgi:hypothetical protein
MSYYSNGLSGFSFKKFIKKTTGIGYATKIAVKVLPKKLSKPLVKLEEKALFFAQPKTFFSATKLAVKGGIKGLQAPFSKSARDYMFIGIEKELKEKGLASESALKAFRKYAPTVLSMIPGIGTIASLALSVMLAAQQVYIMKKMIGEANRKLNEAYNFYLKEIKGKNISPLTYDQFKYTIQSGG